MSKLLEELLEETNLGIANNKQQIRRLTGYKNCCWNPFTYKERCAYYIKAYKAILRSHVIAKRRISNKESDE